MGTGTLSQSSLQTKAYLSTVLYPSVRYLRTFIVPGSVILRGISVRFFVHFNVLSWGTSLSKCHVAKLELPK